MADRILNLSIDKIVPGGWGLSRTAGKVVFVPFTVPGDEVVAQIEESRRDYQIALPHSFTRLGAEHITPQCPYAFQPGKKNYCGGCNWPHIAYPRQLVLKQELLKESFNPLVRSTPLVIPLPLGMKNPWHYRNKRQQPWGLQKKAGRKWEAITGFYQPKSHHLVNIEKCLLQPPLTDDIIENFRQLINRYHLPIYQEDSKRGWLRYTLLRYSFAQQAAQLILVTRDAEFSHGQEILEVLRKRFPSLVAVYQNINNQPGNVILGQKTVCLFAQTTLREKIGQLEFVLPPTSFFQINPQQTEQLVQTVTGFLTNLGGKFNLVDLYAGSGLFTLSLLHHLPAINRALGIELDREGVNLARQNRNWNRVLRTEFVCARVESINWNELLEKYRLSGLPLRFLLNPPRAGCLPVVLKRLLSFTPEQVIYVSCNPATLVRDLIFFREHGYRIQQIQPIDIFPHTPHLECVVDLRPGTPKRRRVD